MTISKAPAVPRSGPRGDTRRDGGTAGQYGGTAGQYGGTAGRSGGMARRWRGNPALTLLAVALGVMMVGIDGTIVAVANPAIQSRLHASLPESSGMAWMSLRLPGGADRRTGVREAEVSDLDDGLRRG